MSDYINGLNNMYLNGQYSQSVSDMKDKITSKDYSKATEEELMEACKSFEQYFIEQAFKGMEKMVPKDEKESTMGYYEMFKDKLYEKYAESATERGEGIGIAKMLFEQMKRNYNL